MTSGVIFTPLASEFLDPILERHFRSRLRLIILGYRVGQILEVRSVFR
jgi:hypothetical protein